MRFFNTDLHISVIADIKDVFSCLGHEVFDVSMSGHAWVMGRQTIGTNILNPNNWESIDQALIDRFIDAFGKNLSRYDGFIATYPPVFGLLYKKLNKPIIIDIPIRYEHPFSHSSEKWHWLNEELLSGVKSGQITLVSNNRYDKEYTQDFLGVPVEHIPSVCAYTRAPWKFGRDHYVVFGDKRHIPYGEINSVEAHTLSPYRWQDLHSYPAAIHFPYNASEMKIFEQYTANMPLVMPSQKFCLELWSRYPRCVMSQLSFNRIRGLPSESIIPYPKTHDPNNYLSARATEHWMGLSDFYDTEWMPFITYFDSFEDIRPRLDSIDVKAISTKMAYYNMGRKAQVVAKWKKVLDKISGSAK